MFGIALQPPPCPHSIGLNQNRLHQDFEKNNERPPLKKEKNNTIPGQEQLYKCNPYKYLLDYDTIILCQGVWCNTFLVVENIAPLLLP